MKSTQKPTVWVGLSGGVDSSVSAYLLKKEGYGVVGVYMQNWAGDDAHCTSDEDYSDAKTICDQLGIPFKRLFFKEAYATQVFAHALNALKAGATPNPDVLCNREIKFKAFLNAAMEAGADFLATGHYARNQKTNDTWQLKKGLDPKKDQSYFLHTLHQTNLPHILFPLGNFEKPKVREIAKQLGLVTATKKDSTGLCFIGERPFKQFLQTYFLDKKGPMKTPEGVTVGEHDGLMYYTIGQRQGLHIGGIKQLPEAPWYVLGKDLNTNTLIVGQGKDHPALFSSTLQCDPIHWIAGTPPALPLFCQAKIRYRQGDQSCLVEADKNRYSVTFKTPQRAVTPGQYVVFYQEDVCLGGAMIKAPT